MTRRAVRSLSLLLLPLLLCGLAACDDGGGSSGPSTDLGGIWAIESWTQNTESCDSEGGEVLENRFDRFVLIQVCTFSIPGLGSDSYMQAVSCETVEKCEEARCTPNHINLSGWTFESGSDEEGWTGTGAPSAYASGDDETCTGTITALSLQREGEGGLRFEERRTQVPDVPRGEETGCDLEYVEANQSKHPCSELEVLHLRPQSAS